MLFLQLVHPIWLKGLICLQWKGPVIIQYDQTEWDGFRINGEQYPSSKPFQNDHQAVLEKRLIIISRGRDDRIHHNILSFCGPSLFLFLNRSHLSHFCSIVKIAQFNFKFNPQLPSNAPLFLHLKERVKYCWTNSMLLPLLSISWGGDEETIVWINFTMLTMLAATQQTEDLIAQLHLIDGILSLTDQLRSFFVKTHINVTRYSKKASTWNNIH